MTQASLRPPTNTQARPKITPTFSGTSTGTLSRSATPQLPPPSSQSRQASPFRAATPLDDPDKAASVLVRRVLCSKTLVSTDRERPIDELLPPLTSSNEVDLQLYAFVAIVVKDLVQTWYGKITSDQSFVDEVVKILAHCTRALESRFRSVDLNRLLLDEIPTLIDDHLKAFRVAHEAAQSQDSSTAARVTYHNLNPHPALEPIPHPETPPSIEEQAVHEANYRQLLAQGALAILLPTEDLENVCLRTLVADVIAGPVLGSSVGGKVCEGWFIWAAVTKLVKNLKLRVQPKAATEGVESDRRSGLEKYGLLATKPGPSPASFGERRRSMVSSLCWRVIQYAYLTWALLQYLVFGLLSSRSGPPRSSTIPRSPISARASPKTADFAQLRKPRPVLEFRIFSLVADLVDLPHRMPWLCGMLALLRHHLSQGVLKDVGGTDGMIDQFLHNQLNRYLPPSVILPKVLSLARQNLFPGNQFLPPANAGSAPLPPSPEQVLRIKRECAESIVSLIPELICKRLLGGGPEQWVKEVELELEVWEDGWMNKHLGYRILEVVMVRVMPELGEKTVKELLEARLGAEAGGDVAGGDPS